MQILEEAQRVLKAEMNAIQSTMFALDSRFEQAIALIEAAHKNERKLIFSGIGKNVFIARKIAATFNSTGVSTLFLDPLSAMHGDVGLCREGDLAFLMSNSGESEEMIAMVPVMKRLGVTMIAFTKDATSKLAKLCDKVLTYEVPAEACPLNLAPTASTTTALALGDALAMVFLKKRGFRPQDFAKYHPGGTLGKTLLLTVADVMRPRPQMAVVGTTAKVIDALNAMTEKKTGLVVVCDEKDKVAGIFTDGDFRRLALKNENPLQAPVLGNMNRTPKTIQSNLMAVEALRRFEEYKIDDLVVIDEFGFPVGIVDSQDLPKLKLV